VRRRKLPTATLVNFSATDFFRWRVGGRNLRAASWTLRGENTPGNAVRLRVGYVTRKSSARIGQASNIIFFGRYHDSLTRPESRAKPDSLSISNSCSAFTLPRHPHHPDAAPDPRRSAAQHWRIPDSHNTEIDNRKLTDTYCHYYYYFSITPDNLFNCLLMANKLNQRINLIPSIPSVVSSDIHQAPFPLLSRFGTISCPAGMCQFLHISFISCS
jgi:hypothetical protein